MRRLIGRRLLVTVGVVAGVLLVPVSVSAVQNIIMQGRRVADMQMGGEKVCEIQHQGQTVYSDPECSPDNILDVDSSTCSTATIGTIRTVRDYRGDGQNYRIRCMEDGRWWMITNLKLGSLASTTTLTPADTNIKSNWTLPQINAGGSVSTTGYYDQPMVDAKVDVAGTASLQTNPAASDFYGYYYNWCAATAGGTASGGSVTCTTSANMPAGDSTVDICPVGWRLPTGGSNAYANDFAVLAASMRAGRPTAGNATGYPEDWVWGGNKFYGVYSGYRRDTAWTAVGSNGHSWSSSPANLSEVYDLYFLNSIARPVGSLQVDRNILSTIRCVKTSPPAYDGIDIRGVVASTCNTLAPIGTIYTVRDTRGESQNYRIRCMEDGRYWMITNLKLGSLTGTTALTPSDTNISTNWTMPQVNTGGSPSTADFYDQPVVDAKVDVAGAGSLQNDPAARDFYGYYYNWCMATAGGTASGGADTCTPSGTMSAGDAIGDICPAGWHLPKGGKIISANDFAALNASMYEGRPAVGSANSDHYYGVNWRWAGNKFYGVWSGHRLVSDWLSQTLRSQLWSSTYDSSSADNAFYASFGHGDANIADIYVNSTNVRSLRLAVRCLAD